MVTKLVNYVASQHAGDQVFSVGVVDTLPANMGMKKAVLLPSERCKSTVVNKVIANQYYQSQKGWVSSYLDKNGLLGANSAIVKKAVLTNISNLLKSNLDGRVFESLQGVEAINECFALQFWQNKPYYQTLTTTPHCLPECRITLEGSELLVGIPRAEITGTTHKEKIQAVSTMDTQAVIAKAQDSGGFWVKTVPGHLLIIPSGFLVLASLAIRDSNRTIRAQTVSRLKPYDPRFAI